MYYKLSCSKYKTVKHTSSSCFDRWSVKFDMPKTTNRYYRSTDQSVMFLRNQNKTHEKYISFFFYQIVANSVRRKYLLEISSSDSHNFNTMLFVKLHKFIPAAIRIVFLYTGDEKISSHVRKSHGKILKFWLIRTLALYLKIDVLILSWDNSTAFFRIGKKILIVLKCFDLYELIFCIRDKNINILIVDIIMLRK